MIEVWWFYQGSVSTQKTRNKVNYWVKDRLTEIRKDHRQTYRFKYNFLLFFTLLHNNLRLQSFPTRSDKSISNRLYSIKFLINICIRFPNLWSNLMLKHILIRQNALRQLRYQFHSFFQWYSFPFPMSLCSCSNFSKNLILSQIRFSWQKLSCVWIVKLWFLDSRKRRDTFKWKTTFPLRDSLKKSHSF